MEPTGTATQSDITVSIDGTKLNDKKITGDFQLATKPKTVHKATEKVTQILDILRKD